MDPITAAEDETVTPVTEETATEEELTTEQILEAVLSSFVIRLALDATKEIRE